MFQLMELVAPSWLLWILGCLLLHTVVQWKHFMPLVLQDVVGYGKLRLEASFSFRRPRFLNVPKRWFTHFYAWGVVWNFSILSHFLSDCITDASIQLPLINQLLRAATGHYVQAKCSTITQLHFDTLIVLFLVCIQVTRRLYECLFVSVFSDSLMSVAHYCIGLYFYTSLGLTVLLHLDTGAGASHVSSGRSTSVVMDYLQWYHIVSVLLFVWGSIHQYSCHKILASLRGGNKKELIRSKTHLIYAIPNGDWFEYVSSPHFLAEIVIYSSLLVCCVFSNWKTPLWFVLLFTVCILGLSARQVHQWYRDRFEDYPQSRRILIPWIF